MKDITHYFTDSSKSCESSTIHSKEVSEESAPIAEEHNTDGSKKKRNRVKIKISRTDSKSMVCDIVNTKNNLIDKTPSPLSDSRATRVASRDDTPKRSTSAKPVLVDVTSNATVPNKLAASVNNNKDDDLKTAETDTENMPIRKKKRSGNTRSNSSSDLIDGASEDDVVETQSTPLGNDERGEPNAFDLLMTRNKPIRYNSSPLSSSQEQLLAAEIEEKKNKMKSNKEKLTALADKKGYSKRKLEELEEAEKIDKRLENRAKMFKRDIRRSSSTGDANTSVNSKQSRHNLLKYFSKTTSEQELKITQANSTVVVEADVHVAKGETVRSTSHSTAHTDRKKLKSRSENEGEDDIQCLSSESLCLSPIFMHQQSLTPRPGKPKWSMRIKLQSYSEDESLPGTGYFSDDDSIFSPKSAAKLTALRAKRSFKSSSDVTSSHDSKKENKHSKQTKKDSGKDQRKSHKEEAKSKGTKRKEKSTNSEDKEDNCNDMTNSKSGSQDVCEYESYCVEDNTTIIDCTEVVEKSPERKLQGKLAPLFVKKQKLDPNVVAARRLFLQSDLGEKERKVRVPKPADNLNTSRMSFPTISHVTQLGSEQGNEIMSDVLSNISMRSEFEYIPSLNVSQFKSVICSEKAPVESSGALPQLVKADIEDALAEMERRCSDVRAMWKTISSVKRDDAKTVSPKGKGRKRKSRETGETARMADANRSTEIQNDTWTCKYKPKRAEDVVGNEKAVERLKNWLSGWKLPVAKEDYSSGDEFYSSDYSCSSTSDSNQVAVLLGPHGSGKSASVYAIAEELGYKVLEVNASSKRSGKKILKDLQEATTSHRVKKETMNQPSLTTSFKHDERITKKSLILVEDVELLFDEDEGFVSATFQLASNTKRPIVFTCRDACPHLSKMAPRQMQINFQAVAGSRVSTLMELISLAETGYRLPRYYLDELLRHGDLRKALLQLQYLLLSGNPHDSPPAMNPYTFLWHDMRYFLYKPAVKTSKKRKEKTSTDGSQESLVDGHAASVLNDLADNLDSVRLLASLTEVEDPTPTPWNAKLTPSLSLDEDTRSYSSMDDLGPEMADWINSKVMSKEYTADFRQLQMKNSTRLSIKRQTSVGVDMALSQVVPCVLERRSTSVDYLPYVRAICRAENVRSTSGAKRGNRFYHYLQSFDVPVAVTRPNILAAACKALQEKTENTQNVK